MSETTKPEWTPELDKENSAAVWAHTIPFLAWLLMMSLLGDPCGMRYLWQTIGGLILLVAFRPWRWYSKPKLSSLPLSMLIGVLVFVLWVGLESATFKSWLPGVSTFYEKYFVDLIHLISFDGGFSLGSLREPLELGENGLHHYDPRTTGWPLFWVHMLGTTLVIGAIEEFMFRGFLYRWMQGSPFFKKSLSRMDWKMCLLVSVIFALEHNEWVMGFICGVLFTWVIIKTNDIWAGIWAHALTNGLLGWYAVHTGAYWFW